MTNSIDILIQLNAITVDLDDVQGWINHARNASPTNQIVQLELDRKQTELDIRRAEVQLALFVNASLN